MICQSPASMSRQAQGSSWISPRIIDSVSTLNLTMFVDFLCFQRSMNGHKLSGLDDCSCSQEVQIWLLDNDFFGFFVLVNLPDSWHP